MRPFTWGVVAEVLHAFPDLLAEIASVGAKIFLDSLRRHLNLRPEDRIDLRRVVLVRPGDDDRQRDATPVH